MLTTSSLQAELEKSRMAQTDENFILNLKDPTGSILEEFKKENMQETGFGSQTPRVASAKENSRWSRLLSERKSLYHVSTRWKLKQAVCRKRIIIIQAYNSNNDFMD